MLNPRRRQILFSCIVLVASCAAIGIRNLRIDELVSASDAIVVADVVRVDEVGLAPDLAFRNQNLKADAYTAELIVRSVIKGSVSGRLSVKYALPKHFIGYQGLREGIRMVFLRKVGPDYTIADPYYPDLPAVESPSQGSGEHESDTYAGEVVRQMLAVVASESSTPAQKSEILRVDYALPTNSEAVAAFKRGLSEAGDTELEQRLEGELIRMGDISVLPRVVQTLLAGLAAQNQKVWLLYVIAYDLKDSRSVPMLQPLLRSDDNSLKEAAARALWDIASPATLPSLARALEDPDERVRFYAVRGCADIANEPGWGGPGEAEFHEHQEKYLKHWKAWVSGLVQG
jgi:hypothetical protein